MSNLRWILLFAGFAILLLLYFTGRPRKTARSNPNRLDAMPQTDSLTADDPLMNTNVIDANGGVAAAGNSDPYARHASMEEFDPAEFDSADFSRPGGGHIPQETAAEAFRGTAAAVPAGYDTQPEPVPQPAPQPELPLEPMRESVPAAKGGTLGSKLDALGARLTGRRKPVSSEQQGNSHVAGRSGPQKVVLLHVVAPEGQVIDGELLLQVFEQRRYHFGDKNIFHSLHQDQTVFSIAKMVEPGSFDVNDIASFETPGLVLILPLPGPVAGDVAFEVLVSEAQELADALGCRVMDSKRSTLSRQTTQHLRENINNYVHRQKYFSKAAV